MDFNNQDEMDEDPTFPVPGSNGRKRHHSAGFGPFSTSTPRSQKRDSGYLTDTSPASYSGHQQFTFEVATRGRLQQGGLRGAVGGSESDTAEGCSPFDPILLENEDEDNDSAFRDSPFSPGPEESELPEEDSSSVQIYRHRSEAFRHVDPAPPVHGRVVPFSMPIPMRVPGSHGRNVGTQTPHEHCRLLIQYLETPLPLTAQGPVHRRQRYYSEGEDPQEAESDNAPLPDIVPTPRDRSVSLPDVQALRQQREIEMGRELRRISDEFNSTHGSRRRLYPVAENFEGEAASFPGARPAYMTVWTSLRSLFFGSMEARTDTEDPSGPS
ncbi:uncharacterized protein LOC124141987 [Haliotis rufescens]|uniref:uncharacterized protein LOC124141987 n=1 Tax=Haliotis rufescens TaxID=6454 RepID=UPI001EB0AD5E|nr:uncharacterized protein LOC124141987 [Haliotis rufescens]